MCLKIIFICLYITPSHYHHCANLPKDIELIKCLSEIFAECVSEIKQIRSQLSIIQYVGLCVLSLSISLVIKERINILCLIIIVKSEVWNFTYCLGLGHEAMVCTVCLSVFLLAMNIICLMIDIEYNMPCFPCLDEVGCSTGTYYASFTPNSSQYILRNVAERGQTVCEQNGRCDNCLKYFTNLMDVLWTQWMGLNGKDIPEHRDCSKSWGDHPVPKLDGVTTCLKQDGRSTNGIAVFQTYWACITT